MSKAYVETTILTNLTLKPESELMLQARESLKRYDSSELPVYSIKEWKAGPLQAYAYVHNTLLRLGSFKATFGAIRGLGRQEYKLQTALQAMEVATLSVLPLSASLNPIGDKEMADLYRGALANIIFRAWRRRRKLTDSTIHELDCYTEAGPKFDKAGLVDLKPRLCEDVECCMAQELKKKENQPLLRSLRDAISPGSTRREDLKRRKVLKQLISQPQEILTREQCRDLGDAIFAFKCPKDSVILTTNVRDHMPLAESLGKRAEAP